MQTTVLILALDSTTPTGSVALWQDHQLLEVRRGDATRTHAERLPGDLLTLLAAHDRTLREIDLFAVVSGPGGFTGLRVGIATVQGLALVGQRPVFTASALLLLAVAAARAGQDRIPGSLLGAWMHAARREVFTALYRPLPSAPAPMSARVSARMLASAAAHTTLETRLGFEPVEEAAVDTPEAVAARWHQRHPRAALRVMGDATKNFAEPLRARFGAAVELLDPPPLAAVLAELAAAAPDLAAAPHALVPTYVRRTDAELARDRASGARSRSSSAAEGSSVATSGDRS